VKCVNNSGIMGYDVLFVCVCVCFSSPSTQHHISEELNLQKTPLNGKSCTEALSSTTVVICNNMPTCRTLNSGRVMFEKSQKNAIEKYVEATGVYMITFAINKFSQYSVTTKICNFRTA